jgi:2-polyprenyl-3-methyl-5-hydroxy-6-metoxy-1,4-benzoquinol methylase
MKSFQHRATETEYLDQAGISASELYINLNELNFINNYLGGHAATIKGLNYFFNKYGKINRILDVGCGGGDTLAAIAKWCNKNKIIIKLTGLDILPEAIEYARSKYNDLNINFICADFNDYMDDEKYDIAINSLTCHHLYDKELINFIKFHSSVSNYGFIINDLQRHPLAYYSISVLTKLFSNSYMVKNDAPLSVRKGFTREEISNILLSCNITNYKISREWAFRYLVIADHDKM